MNRYYFYGVDNVNQLESMKFCPYCDSETLRLQLAFGDNGIVCLECGRIGVCVSDEGDGRKWQKLVKRNMSAYIVAGN